MNNRNEKRAALLAEKLHTCENRVWVRIGRYMVELSGNVKGQFQLRIIEHGSILYKTRTKGTRPELRNRAFIRVLDKLREYRLIDRKNAIRRQWSRLELCGDGREIIADWCEERGLAFRDEIGHARLSENLTARDYYAILAFCEKMAQNAAEAAIDF